MAELPVVPKVSAFITRGRELLVFTQPEHPEAGVQVPAGTMEPGEEPIAAALREAAEETGRTGFHSPRLLDHRRIDARGIGKHEIHDRWYMHMLAPEGLPQTWQHGESDPSEGDQEFIVFTFFWVPLHADVLDHWHDHHEVLQLLRG